MDKGRKTLAIKFYLSYKDATGVVNYFINMVRALNYLQDGEKPSLIILHTDKAPVEDVKKVGYPYITFINVEDIPTPSLLKRAVNKVSRMLTGSNALKLVTVVKADVLLDHYYTVDFPIAYSKKICWICDFQHRYLPDNFTPEQYAWCESTIHSIVKNKEDVLVSSEDSRKDFDKFYYDHTSRVKVLRFPSILPDEYASYALAPAYADKKYFMVSNQFWPHKNHITVVEATAELKAIGLEPLVLFSGHLSDRDPAYASKVKKVIEENKLEENIIFLGFLDRLEQLKLMENSICVIQPSLFEGWSTVVEDCRTLNKFILLSDLRVNREQMQENCTFFDPLNYRELAEKMKKVFEHPPTAGRTDQRPAVLHFARNIVKVLGLQNGDEQVK